jgi:hypothetical protein
MVVGVPATSGSGTTSVALQVPAGEWPPLPPSAATSQASSSSAAAGGVRDFKPMRRSQMVESHRKRLALVKKSKVSHFHSPPFFPSSSHHY